MTADTGGLAPGRYAAELKPVVGQGGPAPEAVAVNLAVDLPVEAVPSRLFFGKAKRGIPATSNFLLKVTGDVPFDPAMLRLENDLGDRLRLTWSRTGTSGYWQATATLTPPGDAPRILKGNLKLGFRAGELPPISIPVIAILDDET